MEVQFRFVGSSDVEISTVVYYEGESIITNTSAGKGSTWTTPVVRVKREYCTGSANALGASESSTLKSQILQDGKVIKESGVSTGSTLTSMISY